MRHVLIQKPDIAAWRDRYLRKKKDNNDLGVNKKPVTYLDETWIHSHYTPNGIVVIDNAPYHSTQSDKASQRNQSRERLEKEYWDKDRLQEIEEREFIISLGGEESSSESEIENESDSMSGIEEINNSSEND
ncbi:hypothetical protein ACJJTC_003962 [Scirpophaga incertulas]